MLKLFDLAGADAARRFSPYCWRVRMALAHKGLEVETIPWRFTEKSVLAPSGQGRVPVLVHDNKWLYESWDIACYLEDQFADRPSLFGGMQGRALSLLHSNMADWLGGQIVRFIVLDVYDHLDARDKAYFRESREKRFGMTLEAVVADRDARLPALRDSLAPLRATLKGQPYFGGDRPLYADYALFSPLQWARCISPFRLLEADDPLALWRDRLLDAYDGLARAAPGYDA
jgi:glutathione S-transferase